MSVPYDVIVNDEVRTMKVKNKTEAVKIADRLRARERASVRVITERGTEVYSKPAPRHINQSPKYSRVVPLPRGVKPPKNALRVAYVRPRRNGAILHDAKTGKYRIMQLDTGKMLDELFDTAAQAGDRLKDGV